MLLVGGSTPDDRQRLRANEEGTTNRLPLRYCPSLTTGQYINTRLLADHSGGVRPKLKHTMSPQDLRVLLRRLWLYTRLAPLGRQLVQMAFALLCCSFTGTGPRILVPPNSIDTTLEDLEAGQEERQEARRLKLTISEHLCQPLICLRDLLQTSLSLSAKSPSSPSFQDFGMIRSMMGSRGSTEKLS